MRFDKLLSAIFAVIYVAVLTGCESKNNDAVRVPGTRENPKCVGDLLSEITSVTYSYVSDNSKTSEDFSNNSTEIEIDSQRWQKYWYSIAPLAVYTDLYVACPGTELLADNTLSMTPNAQRSILTQIHNDGVVTLALYPNGYIVYQNIDGSRKIYRGPDLYHNLSILNHK